MFRRAACAPARRLRGAAQDGGHAALHRLVQFGRGHRARDQPQAQRFGGVEDAPFEQDGQRHRAADQVEQAAHFVRRHRKAQLADRHAEAGRLGGDAQIALRGDLQAAAHAHALDTGQHGMRAGGHRGQRRRQDLAVIALHPGQVGAFGRKLADVGAGGEMPFGAGDNHAAQRSVGPEGLEDLAQLPPHRDRHGIHAARMAQRDMGHAGVDAAQDLPGRGIRLHGAAHPRRAMPRLTCGLPSFRRARLPSSSPSS
ncbi:Uncharacterised protein [Bordetella pertussis]|nr:Uncharacterised protein [Bordetella pertussis]